MATDASDAIDPVLLQQAVAWRVRLFEADLDSSLEFEHWLAEDVAHERAWARLERAWDHLAAAEEAATPFERASLRTQVLKRARRSRFDLLARPLAASIVAAICVGGLAAGGWAWRANRPETYTTALGERRTIVLKDGSSVVLDSGTILAVRYTAGARDLRLNHGQARFAVVHDTSRPFRVQVGDQSVLATGTNFNIDVLPSKTLVTLLQGRVTVGPRPAAWTFKSGARPSWSPVRMVSGQQLAIARGQAAPRLSAIDAGQATAWESGLVVFKDEPLSTAAERISRYASKPVVVDDAPSAGLRISGVFKAGDVPGFVDTVTAYLPVKAAGDAETGVHLASRPAG
jgi:transmembrane sensor